MIEQQQRWPTFGYVQVPGLANRLISRYLRTQRKNMLRFFQERGMFALSDRMNQIRNSRQDMLAKNRMFKEVLNEYAQLTSPPVVSSDVPGVPKVSGEPSQDIVIDETSG
jgi:DNA-binding transcriptional regulator YbjK